MEGREKDYRAANDGLHLTEQARETIRRQMLAEDGADRRRGRAGRRLLYVLLPAAMVLTVFAVLFIGDFGGRRSVQVLAAAQYPEGIDYKDSDKQWERRSQFGPVDETLSRGMRQFAAESAAPALAAAAGQNLCYSPLSLYTALAMTAELTAGQTRQEILDALHWEDPDTLAESMYRYLQLKYTDNRISVLKVANSLWFNQSMLGDGAIRQDTVDTLAWRYMVSSYRADFENPKTAEAMSDWVKKQTKGLLGGKASDFSPDDETALSLISTVYYYDQWYDAFDASRNVTDTFTLSDGTETTAEYMCTTRNPYGVLAEEGYTASTLSMKGGSSITFVLPDEGVTPEDLLADGAVMSRLLRLTDDPPLQYAEVRFRIPKYSFKSELDLSQAVQELGIRQIFSPEEADFSGILTDPADAAEEPADAASSGDPDAHGLTAGTQPLWLSGIRQQTSMSIDEKGCEAAAFTQLDYAGAAMPEDKIIELYLNRPFLILIFCGDEPLFIGVVNQP